MLTESQIDKIFDNELTLDDLFENSPILMSIADRNGHLVKLNKMWEMALGWSIKHLTSTPFMDFVHENDKEITLKAYTEGEIFNDDQMPVSGFVNRYLCKDGSYAKLEWYSTGKNVKGLNLGFAIFKGYER